MTRRPFWRSFWRTCKKRWRSLEKTVPGIVLDTVLSTRLEARQGEKIALSNRIGHLPVRTSSRLLIADARKHNTTPEPPPRKTTTNTEKDRQAVIRKKNTPRGGCVRGGNGALPSHPLTKKYGKLNTKRQKKPRQGGKGKGATSTYVLVYTKLPPVRRGGFPSKDWRFPTGRRGVVDGTGTTPPPTCKQKWTDFHTLRGRNADVCSRSTSTAATFPPWVPEVRVATMVWSMEV